MDFFKFKSEIYKSIQYAVNEFEKVLDINLTGVDKKYLCNTLLLIAIDGYITGLEADRPKPVSIFHAE